MLLTMRACAGPHELEPGEGMWHAGALFVCTPNGLLANLSKHDVRQDDGGTVSVGSAIDHISVNPSILVMGGVARWHGYIERGEWRELPDSTPATRNAGS